MNHKANRQEVVLISGRVYENISLDDPLPAEKLPCYGFTAVRPLEGGVFPVGFESELKKLGWSNRVHVQRNEISLLNFFTGIGLTWLRLISARLQTIDPDVILGHNFEGVDYGILLHRMKDCSISHWSKFGRMRRSEWPKGFGRGAISWGERQIISGRLMCDLSNEMGRVTPRISSLT
jgi:DNA polymerase alpha subunit A